MRPPMDTASGDSITMPERPRKMSEILMELAERLLRDPAGVPSSEAAHVALLFAHVAETGQPHVRPLGAEPGQEAGDRLRTSDGHDRDALAVEIASTAHSEGLDRDLVADAFHEHDRTGAARPRTPSA